MKRLLYKITKELGRLFSRHRKNLFSRLTMQICEIFRNNYENVNFDAKINGEERYLRKIAELNFKTILDAGANIGEWALLASNTWPSGMIFSFEILPKHWDLFAKNTSSNSNIVLNKYGLSDFDGKIEVHYNNTVIADCSATIYPQFLMESESNYYNSMQSCLVKKGSDFLFENDLKNIDLLKIDVEGHELKVIKGFGNAIRNVRLIQFEYGVYNITSRDLLCDFFKYLESFDFIIGKLYPSYVDFFEYSYYKENFLGCNYLAVQKDDHELINHLSKF
jgi:FkbM family methyltransferase